MSLFGALLGFPNGLSIDYEMQRLYWVDAKLDKIETSDFNGENRAVLINDIIHPFGLAVVSWRHLKILVKPFYKELGSVFTWVLFAFTRLRKAFLGMRKFICPTIT